MCSKLTIKTPEWRGSGVLIDRFEHFLRLVLVFEQVNAS